MSRTDPTLLQPHESTGLKTEKRTLYRDIGVEEVWIVDEDGHIRFFEEEEVDASRMAPSCPAEVAR